MNYVDTVTIKSFAEAAEAAPDPVWEILAASASRIFDRAAGVADDFFAPLGQNALATEKSFELKSSYLKLPPYLANSIESVKINDIVYSGYQEKDGYLIFEIDRTAPFIISFWLNNGAKVKAKFGFNAIPADIKFAVIEQALFLFRRKDLSFAEMSGVSSQTVNSPLSPTMGFVAEKYREKFGDVNYFV